MQELAIILLGSNLGNRSAFLDAARIHIFSKIGNADKISSIYESTAWGKIEQSDYLNQVIGVSTTVDPVQILQLLLAIELEMGRERIAKWDARTIDLDLLYYGQTIMHTPDLILPHPFIKDRRFTLLPLTEIYPAFMHPVAQQTQLELLNNCKDEGMVRHYES